MDGNSIRWQFPSEEQYLPYPDAHTLLSKLMAYVEFRAYTVLNASFAPALSRPYEATDSDVSSTAHELDNARSYLLKRQAMTPNSAFYALCCREGLDEFSVFCLAGALYRFFYPAQAVMLTQLTPGHQESSLSLGLLARIFYDKGFDPVSAYPAISKAMNALRPLLKISQEQNPFTAVLEADQTLVDFLYQPLRTNGTLARLGVHMQGQPLPKVLIHQEILEQICAACQKEQPFLLLKGAVGSGKKLFIQYAAKSQNLFGYIIKAQQIFSSDYASTEALLWELEREARLTNLFLAITDLDALPEGVDADFVTNRIERLGQCYALLILTATDLAYRYPSENKQPLTFLFPIPEAGERCGLFQQFAEQADTEFDADLQALANKFLFTPGKIQQTLNSAKDYAKQEGNALITEKQLIQGAYSQINHRLLTKAALLPTPFALDDVILEQKEKQKLYDACAQIKNRHIVYEHWGYHQKLVYGKGTSLLLYGPPGTGKTMAATAIAKELGLEIYRVDSSKIVDKYIGETEKNIGFIFEQARECGAVLFFDEADALFSARSAVGNSNDRNANMETGFLLQCVENYDGISVLATNLKQNIDTAFLRRIKFFVEFPLPDSAARKQLWLSCIPKETPLDKDIDFEFLAQSIELSGGSIKNIALGAAFYAAEQGTVLNMSALVNNAWLELQKEQTVLSPTIFGPYSRLLRK